MSEVVIFTKPSCQPCKATLRRFKTAGIHVHELEATDYPELIAALNHKQAPVVLADGNHWAGYRPDLIDAAIETRRYTS